MSKSEIYTQVEGQKVKLTNLEKILYPGARISKAEIVKYYLQVAPHLLRYINNRPLTLIRFPDGIDKAGFYAKTRPDWTPDWIHSFAIEDSDETIPYLLAHNSAVIAWIANLGGLEIHPMQFTSTQPNPDHFIFDLDPPPDFKWSDLLEIASDLKVFLEDYNYRPFLKTSGSKGLHIYVPIRPRYTYDVMLMSVKSLAQDFIKRNGKRVTLKMNKEKRKGKLLLDIFRNHKGHTTVAPYSLRGKPWAPISMPITWDELDRISSSQHYTLKNYQERLDKQGDAWYNWNTYASNLHDVKKMIPVSIERENDMDLQFMSPMLAGQTETVPSNDKYHFEIKWDGIRAIIIVINEEIKIYSKSGRDLSSKFPELVSDRKNLVVSNGIFDGEIVCLDKKGRPEFHNVISRMHSTGKSKILAKSSSNPVYCYLFDILYCNGKEVMNLPIEERKEQLNRLVNTEGHFRISESVADGKGLYDASKNMNLEGIMAKRKESVYYPDQRSDQWLKIKCRTEVDCIILGYTKGKGDRAALFGALHLAQYDDSGNLIYRGRVGTGFDTKKMRYLLERFNNVRKVEKYILEKVDKERETIWLEPMLSCQIKYASMSSNDTFREPVFLRLKEDE